MKHLFYIHSYVTYFVSLAVTESLCLSQKDCVFMYGRNFMPTSPPAQINHVTLPFSHYPINSFAIARRFWRGWYKLQKLDDFLHDITKGENFKIYTNQTGIDFIRLFISNSRCKGFSYLEEGLFSYCTMETVNTVFCPAGTASLFYKVLLFLNFKGRLKQNNKFYNSGYDAVYGLQICSFPGFRDRVVLPSPFTNRGESAGVSGAVFVLDALYEYGELSKEAYRKGLSSAFAHFKKIGAAHVWLKLHPEHYNTKVQHQAILELIDESREETEVSVLFPGVCLERLAGDTEVTGVKFYVFLSSVGIYAALCNREVYSFARYLGEEDTVYKQRIDQLPAVFKEKVKFL